MASDTISTDSASSSLDFTVHFDDVTDPRIDRHKEHALLDIIGLTICAVVAGADTFVGISRFGASRKEWLKQFLELKNGIPSHDTLGRVGDYQFLVDFPTWKEAPSRILSCGFCR